MRGNMHTSQTKAPGQGSICISRCTVEGVSNHLLGMCEGIYKLDFFYKVTSNTPDLLTKIVLCEGVITWQPEADILVAWRKPAITSPSAQESYHVLTLHPEPLK